MTDLMGGRVQAAIDNVAAVPLIKAGKCAARDHGQHAQRALPDVPTFAEAGLPLYDVTGALGPHRARRGARADRRQAEQRARRGGEGSGRPRHARRARHRSRIRNGRSNTARCSRASPRSGRA
jgi:hypothetical protein